MHRNSTQRDLPQKKLIKVTMLQPRAHPLKTSAPSVRCHSSFWLCSPKDGTWLNVLTLPGIRAQVQTSILITHLKVTLDTKSQLQISLMSFTAAIQVHNNPNHLSFPSISVNECSQVCRIKKSPLTKGP